MIIFFSRELTHSSHRLKTDGFSTWVRINMRNGLRKPMSKCNILRWYRFR